MSLPTLSFAGLVLACTTIGISEDASVLPGPSIQSAVETSASAPERPLAAEPAPSARSASATAPLERTSAMTAMPSELQTEQSDESAASRTLSNDELCETLAAAAQAYDLPLAFFIRLIWQESRFDPSAVSRAGAQGMAQFMPKVAAEFGLADPFDPTQALPVSARFLGDLRRQFGNLGLAAAAYNAGAGRIREWLAKRGRLPKETRSYVMNITGHAPERWVSAQPNNVSFKVPERAPCRELVLAAAEAEREAGAQASIAEIVPLPPVRPHAYPPARAALLKSRPVPAVREAEPRGLPTAREADPKSRAINAKADKPWGVQLAARWSEAKARETLEQLRKRHRAVLGEKKPIVFRIKVAGSGKSEMNRIQIAMETRASAEQLCSSLKGVGGACVVLRN
jgi:Transglycosylase SLT domain/SPOR domain